MRLFHWLAAALILSSTLSLGACKPAKLPKDMPGPPGCGMRDPRSTAPNLLSLAQRMTLQKQRNISEVRPNPHGGLDWRYRMHAGSVFGEQEQVEIYSFDKDGLLVDTDIEMISKIGR